MIFTTLLSFLITTTLSQGYITVVNYETTQDYYLSFVLKNIDTSTCGDSISNIYIYKNDKWTAKNQQYTEDNGDYRVAFDYTDTKFSDMLPISVRIQFESSRTIDLWAIVGNLNSGATFVSTELICDGTLQPTSPTPKPTTKVTKPPTAPTTPYPTAETVCIDSTAMDWRSYNNQIYLNGNRFNMKGLSWFGFETSNYNLYGLDYHSIDWYLDWIINNNFNAIRLPFSQDFVNGGISNLNAYKNVVEKAGERGILIMLDFHSATAGSWTDGLNTINHANAISTWETMADLLSDQYNIFLADVFNEPHDVDNNEWSNWISFCEDVATALWNKGVNWMIAIEGTNWQCDVLSCSWGENLEGIKNSGITFSLSGNRFVWSPHVYGGDVSGNYAYNENAWKSHWGYLVDGSYSNNKAASVIGEFGTKYIGSMQNWLKDLISYLIKIDQRNTFYWCLNPNSGDTGGLLQNDWTTSETAKLAQLKRLQPNPSQITYTNGQICVSNLGDVSQNLDDDTDINDDDDSDNGNGNGGRIKISIKEGANRWWFAVVLSEIPSGVNVKSVKLKGSTMSSWEQGVSEYDYYKFINNAPYSGPFSFKITANGNEITTENVITSSSITAGSFGYANVDNAYNENNNNNNNGLDWTVGFAIIVSFIILIGCIIGLIFYLKKRKNKGQVEFTGTDQQIEEMDVDNNNNDDDDVNQTLEVDVEMHVNDGHEITNN